MPEEIDVACPGCNSVFGVPLELCGETAECAECSTVFEIPSLEEDETSYSGTDTGAIQGLESDVETTNTVRLSRTGIGMIPQVKDNFAFGGNTSGNSGGNGFFGAAPAPKPAAAPAPAPAPATMSAPPPPAPAPAPAVSTNTGAISMDDDDGGVTNTVKLSRSGIGMIPQVKDSSASGASAGGGFFGSAPAPKPAAAPKPAPVAAAKPAPVPKPAPAAPPPVAPAVSTDTGAISMDDDGGATNTVKLSRSGIGMIPQMKDSSASGDSAAGGFFGSTPAPKTAAASKPAPKAAPKAAPAPKTVEPPKPKETPVSKPLSEQPDTNETVKIKPKAAPKAVEKEVKPAAKPKEEVKGKSKKAKSAPAKSKPKAETADKKKDLPKSKKNKDDKRGKGKTMPPQATSGKMSKAPSAPPKPEKVATKDKEDSSTSLPEEAASKPVSAGMLPEWTMVTLANGEELEDVQVATLSGTVSGIIAAVFAVLAGVGSMFAGNILSMIGKDAGAQKGGEHPELLVAVVITAIIAILAFIVAMIMGKRKLALITTSKRAVGVVDKKQLEIKK